MPWTEGARGCLRHYGQVGNQVAARPAGSEDSLRDERDTPRKAWMDLRAASKSEPDALKVREYLEQVADLTRTHADDLAAEIERWRAVEEAPAHGGSEEELYLERHGGSIEELRVRLEGFRQVTGVLPRRFLELRREAGVPDVLELRIAPVPDAPSPSSPLDD